MNKCTCQVCTIGSWLKDKTSLSVWEDWASEGLWREGLLSEKSSNKVSHFLYSLLFKKWYLYLRYIIPFKLRILK